MGIEKPAPGEKISLESTGLVVFDIDGTLLPGTSCERLFFRFLWNRGEIGAGNLLGIWMQALALSRRGRAFVLKANKGYLRGFSPDYVAGVGSDFFDKNVAGRISRKAISRIELHRRNGDRMLLLSGMPEFLLVNFSRFLGIDEFVGSVLEIKTGKLTGRTVGPFPLAGGKVDVLAPVLARNGVLWSQVTAYADHVLDRDLLEKVGRPVAVNAHAGLRTLAEKNGWERETFD